MNDQQQLSLKSRSAWLLFAKVVGFGLGFLLPLLVVRYLAQEQVGLYRESFLVITNAAVLLPLGFSMSAYYYLARERERRAAAIFNILLFNAIVGGLACLALWLFPQIVGNIFRSDELTALTPKIGVVIWLWIFSTFLETAAVANNEARLATAFIIFAQLSKTVLMASAVILWATVEAFLYAAMLQGAVQTVILLAYLNRRFPRLWRGFSAKFFSEQLVYAVPLGLIGILWILQTDLHNYFVGYKYSSADFAVYAYGCFQLPLIGMLAESVGAVLIPRMSELQMRGDRAEMVRLTARAMQKLAFFYFPLYVFLMITAQTFIITLFTEDYLASVPIFLINLTLLPFGILITDPIVRAHREFGRFILVLRVFIVAWLVAGLYFGLERLDMRGMIAAAVIAVLAEKIVAEIFIARRLGVGRQDLRQFRIIGKIAAVSLLAGAVTYLVYVFTKEFLLDFGAQFAASAFHTTRMSVLNFVGGGLTLGISALVFAIVYLGAAFRWEIIEPEEKELLVRCRTAAGRIFKSKPEPSPARHPLTTDN